MTAIRALLVGLPFGDWATWATAVASFLAFLGVLTGLLVERVARRSDIARVDARYREDENRRHLDAISAQARLVDAWISGANWELDFENPSLSVEVDVTFSNGSSQAIRGVMLELAWEDSPGASFSCGVIPPNELGIRVGRKVGPIFAPAGTKPGSLPNEFLPGIMRLSLSFTDAIGNLWLRDSRGVLTLLREHDYDNDADIAFIDDE